MAATFLVAEASTEKDGVGTALNIESFGPKVLITLGIQQVFEQQSLQLSIQGSPDGTEWPAEALLVLPQKFYAGTWSALLDLDRVPGVRFLRAEWKLNRWGRGSKTASFRWYLFAESL